ncbi:hypothetical protein SPSPH_044320 [Sporomusa sphaeroides DSM 2875]|jgi:hypothetical protein|uniref:Uncharacterized protein n=1 Tax=Sporomusa sphaeroides DSM 2875 TaxID=1337886 RepID=A0ABP2CE57_9FIRM|nr:hypothetical protein SPSPH_26580 [Sporomusa sphaeroides DSM 2875]CVK21738.1 hypothetical protein SSPH_04446 [Sporomusa sphaeroides DSM 2875]
MWIIGTVADAYLLTQMIFELSGKPGAYFILGGDSDRQAPYLSTIQTTS